MNSFYRMLAHHVAGYYGLGHFVDPMTKCLVLQKNPQSSCPVLRLFDLVEPMEQMQTLLGGPMTPSQPTEQTHVGDVKIMRRRSSNQDANRPEPDSSTPPNLRTNKSHDQREAEYAAARERIFQDFKPPTEDEEEDLVTRGQPQSGPTSEKAESPKTSFNVDAVPFIPSNNTPPHETTPGQPLQPQLPVYPRRIINIIDPGAAHAPEHILVITNVTKEKLNTLQDSCPGAVFRPRPNQPTSGYIIFPSVSAAQSALSSPINQLDIAPWKPVISD